MSKVTYEESSATVQRAVKAAISRFPVGMSLVRFRNGGYYDDIADAITKAMLAYAGECDDQENALVLQAACVEDI